MNLDTIRTQIGAALSNIPDLTVYADEPAAPVVPCAVVTVDKIDPHTTLDGNMDVYLKVVVLVSMTDWPSAQQKLDGYISPGLSTSVIDKIEGATVTGATLACSLVEGYGKVTVETDSGQPVTFGAATFSVWVLA